MSSSTATETTSSAAYSDSNDNTLSTSSAGHDSDVESWLSSMENKGNTRSYSSDTLDSNDLSLHYELNNDTWRRFLLGFLTFVGIVLLWWFVSWLAVGEVVEPRHPVFAFALLFTVAFLGGRVMPFIKMPPLLGMLVTGFVLRNASDDILAGFRTDWAAVMRAIALAVILLRGGLGLNWSKLKRLGAPTLRLSFLPILFEACVVALLARPALEMDWIWCFLLGFVLAAVSPAVVVPSLLSLQQRGYGVEKGIPTMILAAAGLDDVVSISGFGVFLGVAFSQGHIAWNISRGPVELLGGVVGGALISAAIIYPMRRARVHILYRFGVILALGIGSVLAGRKWEANASGALATMTIGFATAHIEGRQGAEYMQQHLVLVWKFAEPVLFSLIGAAVVIEDVSSRVVAWGVFIIACAVLLRSFVTFACVLGAGFDRKEQLFVTLSWLPKATVQAALGPIALDLAREQGGSAEDIEWGTNVLTLAVLIIMITAPLGAVLIAVTGPKLLQRKAGIEGRML